MKYGGKVRLVGVLGALACVLAAVAGVAPAASAAGAEVDIVSPKQGRTLKSKAVVASVKARGGHFYAALNGKDVTGLFHAGSGGKRKASFMVGQALKPGDATLFVSAGPKRKPAGDQVNFTALSRSDGILAVKTRKRRRHPAPLIHARSDKDLGESLLWLNGKRVDKHFIDDLDDRGVVGELGAHAGLKPGHNTLKVELRQANGLFSRRTIDFKVDPSRPIASAGLDQSPAVGESAALDASATRPPSAGGSTAAGDLTYSWRVLRAPRGSTAKPLDPADPTTSFVPDAAGTYRLQVRVAGPGTQPSFDDLSLLTTPRASGAMGVPIQTITSGNGGTAAGGTQIGYPGAGGSEFFPRTGSWVQMLVLNPKSAVPRGGSWDNVVKTKHPAGVIPFSAGQGGDLLSAVGKADGYLVVLSGQGLSNSSSGDLSNLGKAIERLGGTVATDGVTPDGAKDLASGSWSVIGTPGLTEGHASQNLLLQTREVPGFMHTPGESADQGDPGARGSLTGWLQNATTAGYQFVSPEVTPFDTKWTPSLGTPPDPLQNTIAVGGDHYTSAKLAAGETGIQLLVLDSHTLTPVISRSFRVVCPSCPKGIDSGGIFNLDSDLHKYISDHAPGHTYLILVQDYGLQDPSNPHVAPGNASADWVQDRFFRNFSPGARQPDNLSDLAFEENLEGDPWFDSKNLAQTALKSYTMANSHGLGSVAGNLAQIAGLPVHDVVANYLRPVYDSSAASPGVVSSPIGGLTVVGSTNSYQESSAFSQGPPSAAESLDASGNPVPLAANGRATGVLQRNEQSQWRVEGASGFAGAPGISSNPATDSFDGAAFPVLLLAPPAPWPCTPENPDPAICGTSDPGQLAAALAFLSAVAASGNQAVTDIRTEYSNPGASPGSWATNVGPANICPANNPGFSLAVCKALQTQLLKEFGQLNEVIDNFNAWKQVLTETKDGIFTGVPNASCSGEPQGIDNCFDPLGISTGILASVQKAKTHMAEQKAKLDIEQVIEDIVFSVGQAASTAVAASGASELGIVPSVMSAIGYTIEAGDKLWGFYDSNKKATAPATDDVAVIADKASELYGDFAYRLTQANLMLDHYRALAASDPVKLEHAAQNFNLQWALSPSSQLNQMQGLSVGLGRSLYTGLMPLAYDQFALGPSITYNNPKYIQPPPNAGSTNCTHINSVGDIQQYQPLKSEPQGAVSSVTWGPDQPWFTGYTVRFLKAVDYNMKIVTYETFGDGNYDYNTVDTNGDNPSSTLMKPLFAPIDSLDIPVHPTSFGMDKDVFFAQWNPRVLQCGWGPGYPVGDDPDPAYFPKGWTCPPDHRNGQQCNQQAAVAAKADSDHSVAAGSPAGGR